MAHDSYGKVTNTRKRNTQERQERQERSPFPAGDNKYARIRQNSITKTNIKPSKQNGPTKEAPPGNGQQKSVEDLNMFHGTNLILNFDVDKDA